MQATSGETTVLPTYVHGNEKKKVLVTTSYAPEKEMRMFEFDKGRILFFPATTKQNFSDNPSLRQQKHQQHHFYLLYIATVPAASQQLQLSKLGG